MDNVDTVPFDIMAQPGMPESYVEFISEEQDDELEAEGSATAYEVFGQALQAGRLGIRLSLEVLGKPLGMMQQPFCGWAAGRRQSAKVPDAGPQSDAGKLGDAGPGSDTG